MTDQVNKLREKGIKATLLGSAQKEVDLPICSGEFQVAYATPESFYNKFNKQPERCF